MSQYLVLNRIDVQNANAIAGFTWGFPAITHFMGFSHNLSRKLLNTKFDDINLGGCVVIAHHHKVHTYGSSYNVGFTQSRNPPYLQSHDQTSTPPVIEEGKMNMTVSLLIECTGNIGNRQDDFLKWLEKTCFLQRLAGGTILNIQNIELCNIEEAAALRVLKRKLLPGFILMDRANYLAEHLKQLKENNTDIEMLDAWLDFISLKQKARPKSDLINKHLINEATNSAGEKSKDLLATWSKHLSRLYQENDIPESLQCYFEKLEKNIANKNLLEQWDNYCAPNSETSADWEYVPKPFSGFLVPIMIGYKAISPLYKNNEVGNTRDNETPVCFVESAHSVGEWLSVHRLKKSQDFEEAVWQYHYEENWYLCKQVKRLQLDEIANEEITVTNLDDDF